VDSSGNAYVTGYTDSSNFPTMNPLQPASGGGSSDAFVAKINPTGSALIYSTYLGGSGGESGGGIAVDSSGDAYVTGSTSSTDFPTKNPLQPEYGGGYSFAGDAYVSKINAAGSALVYSTYLGGSGRDGGYSIAVDSAGNAYVTGHTGSFNFPITPGAFQTTCGDVNQYWCEARGDAFVSKINPAGSALVYSTYLGGHDLDRGYSIAVDSTGSAYVTGETYATDFPTVNPLQPASGGPADAFVSKFNPSGSALVYSTYLGGKGPNEGGGGIAVDSSGSAYVTGTTNSWDFPTVNALQPTYRGGDEDAFVSELNPSGSALVYSTYLGGRGYDTGRGIAVDSAGNAYVTGYTQSADFPTTPGAFQTVCNGGSGCYPYSDAFVSKFSFGIGPPTNIHQCKKGGWKVFTIPRKFKNQGDCVSFVNTGK
jgi:Beta-propeller repeat